MYMQSGQIAKAVATDGWGTLFNAPAKDWSFTVDNDDATAIVATMKVMGSVLKTPDTNNADHWFELLSVTAKGTTHVTNKPAQTIALLVSGYSAGKINVDFAGF